MSPSTLLLRQIHPSFVQSGRVTSQAFRPSLKDEDRLSVDDGDRVAPAEAHARYMSTPGCHSVGVVAVTMGECEAQRLPVLADGHPYPEHCSIDFSACASSGERDRKAKHLSRAAQERGWLFQR